MAVRSTVLSAMAATLCVALSTPLGASLGASAASADDSIPPFNVLWTLDETSQITTSAGALSDRLDNGIPSLDLRLPRFAVWDAQSVDRSVSPGWQRIFSADPCATRSACTSFTRGGGVRLQPRNDGLHVGATVRVGEQGIGINATAPTTGWYAFAGADTQALRWDLRHDRDDSRFQVRDTRLLGDLQVGIGRTALGGDLTIGYIGREVSHMGASRTEQFGGITFGWSG